MTQAQIHHLDVSDEEHLASLPIRFRIAAARRMLYREGLDSGIGGHVSLRGSDGESYWITPVQYFDETMPDDVVRISFDGELLEGRPGELGLAPAVGFHAAIYRARPDVQCVIHTHSFYVNVLSTQGIPFDSYHHYSNVLLDGVAYFDDEPGLNPIQEDKQIAEALGDKQAVVMRYHGAINVGPSLEATTIEAIYLEYCSKAQVLAMGIGGKPMSYDVIQGYRATYDKVKAREMIFEALMRRLRKSDPDLFEAIGSHAV